MSTPTASPPAAVLGDEPRLPRAGALLGLGAVFALMALLGAFVPGVGPAKAAMAWLVAVCFWTAIALGALLLVMIHHVFDAGWSTVVRRTLEHWLAVFPWLALMFAPLVAASFVEPGLVWKWMDAHDPAIAGDVLYTKKSAFLDRGVFVGATAVFFAAWVWLSARLRRHSFAQDDDGSVEHTFANRRTAAFGLPLAAITLTFAAFFWLMSLEYHWFSTMFGVWFFAGAMRAALAFATLLCLYLAGRGVLRGIFGPGHLLDLGNLMLAFTVFWAYVTFSQYFLIWNANVPEETFWYHLREMRTSTGESSSWWWVGLVLIFGHFVVPFLFLLQHPLKKKRGAMVFICLWVLAIEWLDLAYNAVPALKQPGSGGAVPFGATSPWDLAAVAAVGAVCLWAFFRSFARTRCIPVRDPRILESLHHHE